MKIAIMQPYIFPYLGYFQLINAVDTFVFYDDVNFIKKGYINRNSILVNNEKQRFTVPCKAISQNKKINEIEIDINSKKLLKLEDFILNSYKKAPYFEAVKPILIKLFKDKGIYNSIAEMSKASVQLVANYLKLSTHFEVSSVSYPETQHLIKDNRLMAITNKAKAKTYINAIGGKDLYTKEVFAKENIELKFLKTNNFEYSQFNDKFVPWLSIIDVLMFNDIETVLKQLNLYTFE